MEQWREELYHHGILGQKWGVRRYQNKDGILTKEGRMRLKKDNGKLNHKGKRYLKRNVEGMRSSSNSYKYHVSEMKKLSNATINETRREKRVFDKAYSYNKAMAIIDLDKYKKYETNVRKLIGKLDNNRYTLSENDKKRLNDKI